MQIGFVGLGKMGGNMARRLLERGGHEVFGFDLSAESAATFEAAGGRPVASLEALMQALKPPRAVWLMVPAGAPVDATLDKLLPHGREGDVFIDGGNSLYKDSLRRGERLAQAGFHYLDVGTSGGVYGLANGYCLMIGGPRGAFERLEPIFETLAPKDGYAHVGASGAGHFSKMVHNGIEYGLMQAYAEGFALLEASRFDFKLDELAHLWNQGSVVRSWLLELTERALEADPTLEKVRAYVDDTGFGRGTVEAAIELGVPTPVIAESLFARFRSRRDDNFGDRVLSTLRNQFGGHAMKAVEPAAKK